MRVETRVCQASCFGPTPRIRELEGPPIACQLAGKDYQAS